MLKIRMLPAAALALAACGGKDAQSSSQSPADTTIGTRDSAGAQLIRSAPKVASIKLSATPVVNLGGKIDDKGTELNAIIGAILLSDGTIVVASAPNTIRFFGPDGKLRSSVGKEGSGPGEFRGLNGIWVGPGDTVVASDLGQMRIALFGPDGTFGRQFALGGSGGIEMSEQGGISMTIPHGQLADGTLLGSRLNYSMNTGPSRGIFRDSLTLSRFARDGSVINMVGRFPALEMMTLEVSLAGQSMGMPSPLPLGKQSIIVPGKDRLYIAENIHWEVKEVSPEGKLLRALRLNTTPVSAATNDIEAKRQEQLDEIENNPSLKMLPAELKDQFLKQVRTIPLPKTLPWITAMVVAPDGTLWVQQPSAQNSDPRPIAVFSGEGKLLGTVNAPPRFTITSAINDKIIGLMEEGSDSIRVHVYKIEK